ncbi:MAG: GIY-YIG nuclease family protein [Candidatus Electrothrix sp. AUS1_2]|nr:GIY-YIG nuclease family protein [Candidatus Electrothrix sp. AUS1_2]
MLLCTFIHEKYSLNNIDNIARSIDYLFSPRTNNGWASAGVYCFWDTKTYEILYVGLAVDLAQRFKQHNGLIEVNPNGCKRKQILDWFNKNEMIGYSILAQSSFSQPSCTRFNIRNGLTRKEMDSQYGELVQQGHEAIVRTEGLLIEAHRKAKGRKPRWNKVSGSKIGAERATASHYYLLKLFCGEEDDWNISRKSILTLYQNATYEKWEDYLHAIRLFAITHRYSFNEALKRYHEISNKISPVLNSVLEQIKSEIIDNNYLPKKWTI